MELESLPVASLVPYARNARTHSAAQVAQIAGGQFYRATDTKSLEQIYADIDKLEKSTVSVKKYQQYRDLFPLCLMTGVGLLVGQVLLSQTIWKKLP